MKLFFKNYKTFIIVFVIMIGWCFSSAWSYERELREWETNYNQTVEDCKNNYRPFCDSYLESSFQRKDAISVFFYIMTYKTISYLQIIAPLIVMICAVWFFSKKISSGYIKHELMRISYKKWFFQNVFSAMKSVFILPATICVLFLLSYFISGGNLHYVYSFTNGYINPNLFPDTFSFWCLYILIIFLHSAFYVNLSLIFARKNKNIVVVVIEAYLAFLALNIVSEVGIGFIVSRVLALDKYAYIFNLFGIFVYDRNCINLWMPLIYAIFIMVASFIALEICYKDKEVLFLETE